MTDEREGLTSASRMERRILCPGSEEGEALAIKEGFAPESDTTDSIEGEKRHQYIEFDQDPETVEDIELAIMLKRTKLLLEEARDAIGINNSEGNFVFRERRLFMTDYNGKRIASAKLDYLEINGNDALIVDWKTLYGYHEDASSNYQLRTQAVCVADNFGVEKVTVALIQPTLESGKALTMSTYNRNHLEYAEDEIIEAIRFSQSANAPRKPGVKQCKFCTFRLRCPEYNAAALAFPVMGDFPDFPITPYMVEAAKLAKAVAENWEIRAKDQLKIDPESLEGWGLRKGNRLRKIKSNQEVISKLADYLTSEQILEACVISVPEIEKLYRRETGCKAEDARPDIEDILGSTIEYEPQAPSLTRMQLVK